MKQLKAWEDDCDSLRVAGSRLQARTGQLEARLDTEIEQLHDELTDLDKAGSAMRSVDSRCMKIAQRAPKPNGCGTRETPGVQHEGVAKIRQFAQHGSRILRPRQCEGRGSERRALRPKSHVGMRMESCGLWVFQPLIAMSGDCIARARDSLLVGELQ